MEKIIAYLKDNLILGIILIAVIAILIILIIAAIIRACIKSKKNKKQIIDVAPTLNQPEQIVREESKTVISSPVKVQEPRAEIIVNDEQTQTPAQKQEVKEIEPKVEPVEIKQETSKTETPKDEQIKNEPKKQAPVKKATQKVDENKKTAEKKASEPKAVEKKVVVSKTLEKKTVETKPSVKKVAETKKDVSKKPEEKATTVEPIKTAYSGKWVISESGTNTDGTPTYCFELRASNGEKLLSSVDYKSLNGAKNGIKTYKTNIEKDNFTIAQNKKGDYFFKLLNGSGNLLSTGETYPNKTNCENAVDSVKRFAATAIIFVDEKDE